MPTAIIYARRSPRPDPAKADARRKRKGQTTKVRTEPGLESIGQQLALCRAYCERQGYRVKAEYQDDLKSGADAPDDAHRRGLFNALNALRRGDRLVALYYNRFARDGYLAEHVLREAAKRQARLESASGERSWVDDPANPDAPMIRAVLREADARERRWTALRTSLAMLARQANGERMAYNPPYGWRIDVNNPARLVEDKREQDGIKIIVELHEAGHGLRAICRELMARNRRCRRRPWRHSTVKKILRRTGRW